ncbi:MAG: hypothetical protein IKE78_08855 [Erysipelotrichaceae bacterium]|nr:hypothetical protein [Erysipelotrichaceae bacterium]
MNKTRRELLLIDCSKDSINEALHIAGMDRTVDYDLLYVSGVDRYGLREFPLDIVFDIYRNAKNIVGCYNCDGKELGKYIREKSRTAVYAFGYQYRKMGLTLLQAYHIRKGKYDRVIHCSPHFERRLYETPADMILKKVKYIDWTYPITDYGIIPGDIDPRYIYDINPDMSCYLPMDDSSMRDFCREIIDSGILDRMTMEEADMLPF